MKIAKDIEIIDLALKIKDTLIISDLQIGIEGGMQDQGILVPVYQFDDVFARLQKIVEKTKAKRIVINGDLKHEFGSITNQEWRYILRILDYLLDKMDVIIVKGNHDVVIKPIASKRDVKVVDYYKIDDVLILHGHNVIDDVKKAKTIIIGHGHPAIRLKSKVRSEKYKCFLKGSFLGQPFRKTLAKKEQTLIVMPSFNMLSEGTDVLDGEILGPFLKQSLDDFEVYVVEDKVYKFGKIKDLRD